MEVVDGKAVLTFDHVGNGWRPFDVAEPQGFRYRWRGQDILLGKSQHPQDGRVEVSCADVPKPVAVRYAWADNPVCNMYNNAGLPLTPFRTDDWPGVTINNK